ncbi:MAG: ATP-binding protein [Promethearchaeota archaeon]
MFNRTIELKLLKKAVESDKAELIVIYGRRRSGKTTLCLKLLEEFPNSLYLFTPQGSIDDILDIFSNIIRNKCKDYVQFKNWNDFLNYLKVKSSKKFVVVIDEFQRITEPFKPAISMLQHYWDNYFSKSKIKIILVGSVIGMIERIALNGNSPLFGRKTHELKISILPYYIVRKYWENLSEEQRIERYGFFGGTPGYFCRVSNNEKIEKIIKNLILSPDAPLARGPESLISEELRAPSTYMTILGQLSRSGRGLPLSKIKIRRGTPTNYLNQMFKMDIIEKLESLAQGKVLYMIKDEFFRFWFYFIYPRQNLIESNRGELILNVIECEKDRYLSVTFEKILRESILYSAGRTLFGKMIPPIEKIGGFWWKDLEVDCCAIGSDTVIVGEAKWQKSPVKSEDAQNFIKKMQLIKNLTRKKKAIGFYIFKSTINKSAENIFYDDVIYLDLNGLGKIFDKIYQFDQ